MLKKVALLVALAYGSVLAQQTAGTNEPAGLVPGTIYNTGNIVQQTTTGSGSTWTGAVYQDNLTCWAWGDPGYCGPNAIVRPGNSLNFSYGSTYVYQQQHITTLLPSSTGLQVNGYNFSFMAKNGNGWDNGMTDQLTALVRFWDNTGGKGANNLLYGTSYNLSYQFNWTNFNYNETFNKPLAVPDVGLVQYGFIGRDNNGWAGPYGPEIYNISFNVKYSVDPCLKDPLYSPTCPGYLEALNKLLPPATVVSDPVATVATTATVVTEPVVATTTTSTTSSAVSTGQPSVVASVVSAPAPITNSSSSGSSSSTSTSSSSQSKESISSGGSTSLALSIISKNSDRDAAGSAVAQAAVSQAQAAATQAQQEAASVAASAVANSTTMNAATVGSQQSSGTGIKVNNNNNNNSTNFTLQSGVTSLVTTVGGPQTTNNNTNIVQQQNYSGLGLNISNNQPVITVNTNTQQTNISESVTTFALPLLQPQQPISSVAPSVFVSVEPTQVQQQTSLQNSSVTTQSVESYAVSPQNFLTDKSNPLTDIVEGKNTVPQNSAIATTGPTVNRNTSDNEVAGGVDINKMALAPVGYGDYLSLTLRDAAFYAPKEVYKNQRNVDNARVLRLLTNDSKHKEMVEMQYGK